jgi:inner membrane protein
MDPLTQATAGAAAAALLSRKPTLRCALAVGAAAGALPDVDVLIRSSNDPLLALEYHRHFTHALVMAPFLGLLVAGFFRLFVFRRSPGFRTLALFGMAGALTHGVIDACTSYGTSLYWPFSPERVSWDVISIIDPLFTVPLLGCVALAFLRRSPVFARAGTACCCLYLLLGLVQRERAEAYALDLAESRGHVPETLSVRPSFANILLWRLIYREGPQYHLGAVALRPFAPPEFHPGGTVRAFTPQDTHAIAPAGTVLHRDVERFRFFSQGFLFRLPDDPAVIGDLRYAMLPDEITPLWGIRFHPARPGSHVSLDYFRQYSEGTLQRLLGMIAGQPGPPVPRAGGF